MPTTTLCSVSDEFYSAVIGSFDVFYRDEIYLDVLDPTDPERLQCDGAGRRGHAVVDHGHLAVIQDGIVSFCALGRDGKEVVVTLLGPGARFGNAAFCPGLPRVLHAPAHSPTSLLEVPAALFRELLASNPDAAMAAAEAAR